MEIINLIAIDNDITRKRVVMNNLYCDKGEEDAAYEFLNDLNDNENLGISPEELGMMFVNVNINDELTISRKGRSIFVHRQRFKM